MLELTQRVAIVASGGLAVYAEVLVLGQLASGSAGFAGTTQIMVLGPGGEELFVGGRALSGDRASLSVPRRPCSARSCSLAQRRTIRRGGALGATPTACAGYDRLPSGAGVVMRAACGRLDRSPGSSTTPCPRYAARAERRLWRNETGHLARALNMECGSRRGLARPAVVEYEEGDGHRL
jgi:hypothetical protein